MPDNQTTVFTGRVIVDDQLFEGCTFRDAQLVFLGGMPPVMRDCRIENAALAFEGPAHNTIQHLRAMAAVSSDFRAALLGLMPELDATAPQPAND